MREGLEICQVGGHFFTLKSSFFLFSILLNELILKFLKHKEFVSKKFYKKKKLFSNNIS